MTSPTLEAFSHKKGAALTQLHNRNRASFRAQGFSATELIIVIAILAILAALVITAVSRTQKSANTIRIQSDLQAISSALEQYNSDFKIYPGTSSETIVGTRVVLAKALIGPGNKNDDGADGTGFAVVSGGKQWPPYLAPEKFKVANWGTAAAPEWMLFDHLGNVIEYFPQRRFYDPTVGPLVGNGGAPNNAGATIANANYDLRDCWHRRSPNGAFQYGGEAGVNTSPTMGWRNATDAQNSLKYMVGDNDINNKVDPAKNWKVLTKYILCSPGIDGKFFNVGQLSTTDDRQREYKKCDDVYNFERDHL